MSYTNISDKWGAAVEVTADDYRKQAEIFGVEVVIDECAAGIYIDGELVAEAMAMDTSKTPKGCRRDKPATGGNEETMSKQQLDASQVLELAQTSFNKLAIASHGNNYLKLIAHLDDDGIIDEAFTTEDINKYDRRGNGYTMLYQVGTGSTPCNCDACQNGDDPADWAGDDSDALCYIEDEIEERIAELGR